MAFPGVSLYDTSDVESQYTTNSFQTLLDRIDNRPRFGQLDVFSLVTAASDFADDGLAGIAQLLRGGWANIGRAVGANDETLEFLARYNVNDDGETVENVNNPWRNAKTDLEGNPWNENLVPGGIIDYKDLADGLLSTLLGGYLAKTFGPLVFRGGLSLFGSFRTEMFRRGVKRDLDSIKNMRDLGSDEFFTERTDVNSSIIQTDSVPELLLAISEAFFYDNRARLGTAMDKMRARVNLDTS